MTLTRACPATDAHRSLPYFFGHMDRLFEANYGPTQLDIIHAKDGTTTGITETSFKGTLTDLNMITIGRMVGERRKWIHCFENVTALVFLVSLSEYDQMLYEDESVVSLISASSLDRD